MSWKIFLQPTHDLYLFVRTADTRGWVQRLVIRNRYRELEPGAATLVPLAEAREHVLSNRMLVHSGSGPLADACRFERVPTSAKVAQCVLEGAHLTE